MKKRLKIVAVILLCCLAVSLVACKKNQSSGSSNEYATPMDQLSINESKLELDIGDTFNLRVYEGVDAIEAEWSTTGDCITVSEYGEITARRIGSANVTAKVGKNVISCEVNVTVPKVVPTVVLNAGDELKLKVGDTFTVIPTLVWKGREESYSDIEYSITGSSIEIKVLGEACLLTATKVGEAKIIIACDWNGVGLYKQMTIKVS